MPLRLYRNEKHTNRKEPALCRSQSSPGPAPKPSVEIVEEPAVECRFRYEKRVNCSVLGANSTEQNKTYPTIRVNNYEGQVEIRISCVTMDEPYRPHPHKLVTRNNSECGVISYKPEITERKPTVQFKNISIQCTTKEDFADSLEKRAEAGVDPFRTGFEPNTYSDNSLHYVRLAFQVFVEDAAGQCRMPLRSIASLIITDYKKLTIKHSSHSEGVATGGTKLLLFTERLPGKDVKITFYEQATNWKAQATIEDVHRMYGLVVTTPPYRDSAITQPVKVWYYLSRPLPSGYEARLERHFQSDPTPFEYTPVPSIKAKSKSLSSEPDNLSSLLDGVISRPCDDEMEQMSLLDNAGPSHQDPYWQNPEPLYPELQCPPLAQVPSNLSQSASTPLEMQALADKEMTSKIRHFADVNNLPMGQLPVYPRLTHAPSNVLGGQLGYDHPGLNHSPMAQVSQSLTPPPMGQSNGLERQIGQTTSPNNAHEMENLISLHSPEEQDSTRLSHFTMNQYNRFERQEGYNHPLTGQPSPIPIIPHAPSSHPPEVHSHGELDASMSHAPAMGHDPQLNYDQIMKQNEMELEQKSLESLLYMVMPSP